MKIIASAQQKGGVGKTTTLVNLSYYISELLSLSNRTKRILLIDFDPQENLTNSVCKSKDDSVVNASMLFDENFNIAETPPLQTCIDNVDIIRAGNELSDIESMNFEAIRIPAQHVKQFAFSYDYVLIDTPPSLGRLSLSALCMADFAYAPIKMDDYSLSGLEKFLTTIEAIKVEHNKDLVFLGVMANLLDMKDRYQVSTLNSAKEAWGDLIFKGVINQASAIPAAIREGRAVWYKPSNGHTAKVGKKVKEAAREVVQRCIDMSGRGA